jgi:importin subunit beta-1
MSGEDRTDQFATATLGLIGDFGETYGKQVKDVLMEEWVVSAIAYGRQRGASKQARRNATYAQKVSLLVCNTVARQS